MVLDPVTSFANCIDIDWIHHIDQAWLFAYERQKSFRAQVYYDDLQLLSSCLKFVYWNLRESKTLFLKIVT